MNVMRPVCISLISISKAGQMRHLPYHPPPYFSYSFSPFFSCPFLKHPHLQLSFPPLSSFTISNVCFAFPSSYPLLHFSLSFHLSSHLPWFSSLLPLLSAPSGVNGRGICRHLSFLVKRLRSTEQHQHNYDQSDFIRIHRLRASLIPQ